MKKLTKDGYPTKAILEYIDKYDIIHNSIMDLIKLIQSIWHWKDYCKIKGKNIIYLELHTGGWSGNESIIRALRNNLFWVAYWRKSRVGGHYYFRITEFKFPIKSKAKSV